MSTPIFRKFGWWWTRVKGRVYGPFLKSGWAEDFFWKHKDK